MLNEMEINKNIMAIGPKGSGKAWFLNKLLTFERDEVLFRMSKSASSSERDSLWEDTRSLILEDGRSINVKAFKARGVKDEKSMNTLEDSWNEMHRRNIFLNRVILVVNFIEYKYHSQEILSILEQLSKYLDNSSILIINRIPNKLDANLENKIEKMQVDILHRINREINNIFRIENDISEDGGITNNIENQKKFKEIRKIL